MSYAQFRAGSSIRGSGGKVHPAAQLIPDPRYDDWITGFDVAVARVSDNVFAIWFKTRLMRQKIWFKI